MTRARLLRADVRARQDWGTLYFNDGLHLTPEGNEEVLRQLLQVLEQHFPDLK